MPSSTKNTLEPSSDESFDIVNLDEIALTPPPPTLTDVTAIVPPSQTSELVSSPVLDVDNPSFSSDDEEYPFGQAAEDDDFVKQQGAEILALKSSIQNLSYKYIELNDSLEAFEDMNANACADILLLKEELASLVKSYDQTSTQYKNQRGDDEINAKISEAFPFALMITLKCANNISPSCTKSSCLTELDGFHLVLSSFLREKKVEFSLLDFYLKNWGFSCKKKGGQIDNRNIILFCDTDLLPQFTIFTNSNINESTRGVYAMMKEQISFLTGPGVEFEIEGEGVNAKLAWRFL